MKRLYSIQELVKLQSVIQNSSYPNNRQGFEYRAKKENWSFEIEKSTGRNGTKKLFIVPIELALIIDKHINPKPSLSKEKQLPIHIDSKGHLTDAQREIAAHKLIIVRYLEQKIKAGQKKTPTIQQFIDDANNQKLPEPILDALNKANAKSGSTRTVSRRSLFDWMKAVDDAEKHNIPVLSVLAPKQRINPIPVWADALIKVWGQPQKPTLAACMELLPNYLNGSPCPSYAQARRFLKEKMGNVEVMRGRMGTKELRNIQPFIRRGTESLLPSDVYTADGHCFDAEVAHPLHGRPFRPEITSIIDVATRRVVGWSISLSESSWCVLDAIRMSATTCGIPAIFYVDNGSGYKNDLLNAQGHGVLARLNTEISHALPYNSQAKGIIERSHQTLWVKAARNLPTYIGKDMDNEASNAVHKLTRNEIKKFGSAKALMTWKDFLCYAEQVVDAYNNKPHSGLKRFTDPNTLKKRYQTPIEAWNEAISQGAPIDLVEDWDAEDLFRPYEERKVRRGEIELFGNRYFSADLEQFHGDAVLVGYDIHNADKITVRNVEGQFICHALWNANKRDYFPKTKIEQAVEKRAQGRLRRLAVHQAEALAEVSPKAVLEHINNQDIIPFDEMKRKKLMEELHALPVDPEQNQPFFKAKRMPLEDERPIVKSDKIQRWIEIDQKIQEGEIVSEEDQDFWKLFPSSKKFKQISMSDGTLKSYLECRQA